MSEQCEFCEIDGQGNHAPRCPVHLESEIERLQTITRDQNYTITRLRSDNQSLQETINEWADKYNDAREAFEMLEMAHNSALNRITDLEQELRVRGEHDE
jgi:predicted nuclease with TOPRIM domain